LAPRSPGANPTINKGASIDPNDATGALNQSGSFSRHVLRKATSRGQRGQSRPGFPLERSIFSICEAAPARSLPAQRDRFYPVVVKVKSR
jgi:hypothetical protein